MKWSVAFRSKCARLMCQNVSRGAKNAATCKWTAHKEGRQLRMSDHVSHLWLMHVQEINHDHVQFRWKLPPSICWRGVDRNLLFTKQAKSLIFDICLTVHHWHKLHREPTRCNNNILLIIPISSTCFGRWFRPSSGALDCIYSLWYKAPTTLLAGNTV